MLTLEYDDAKFAIAIAAAISPDNLKPPSEMTLATMPKGNAVNTQIDFDGRMDTFIATIDDLLFCIIVAEKSLETLRHCSQSRQY